MQKPNDPGLKIASDANHSAHPMAHEQGVHRYYGKRCGTQARPSAHRIIFCRISRKQFYGVVATFDHDRVHAGTCDKSHDTNVGDRHLADSRHGKVGCLDHQSISSSQRLAKLAVEAHPRFRSVNVDGLSKAMLLPYGFTNDHITFFSDCLSDCTTNCSAGCSSQFDEID